MWTQLPCSPENWVDSEETEEHRGEGICLGNCPNSTERGRTSVYADCKLFEIRFQCPNELLTARLAGHAQESSVRKAYEVEQAQGTRNTPEPGQPSMRPADRLLPF